MPLLVADNNATGEGRFDAFLSYSSDPDYQIARSLESFLEAFHRLPTAGASALPPLQICRDGSDFTLLQEEIRDPNVPEVIAHHLGRSRILLLICSRGAARSPWVDRELQWWLEEARRSPSQILVAITEGEDPEAHPEEIFSPRMIEAGLHLRPWYDLRQSRGRRSKSWRKVRLLEDERVRLAADLSGRAAGEILPLWYRQQRRTLIRQRTLAGISAAIFLVIALVALLQYLRATKNERISLARQLAAQATASLEQRPRLSALLALASLSIQKDLGIEGEAWGEVPLREVLRQAIGLEFSRGEERKSQSPFIAKSVSSPNSRWLAISEMEGIREYDLVSPNLPSRFFKTPTEPSNLLKMAVADDGTLALWSLAAIEVIKPGLPPMTVPVGSLVTVGTDSMGAIFPDGGKLLYPTGNGHLHLTDFGSRVSPVDLGDANGRSVLAVSPNGCDIARGNDAGRLLVYQLDASREIDLTAAIGPGEPFDWLAFDATGLWLAAHREKGLYVWDLKRLPAVFRAVQGSGDEYDVMALSRNGRFLAQSQNGIVLLWKTPFHEQPVRMTGEARKLSSLKFSYDGRWLAGVDRGATVLLWDMENLSAEPEVLRGKDEEIEGLTFTADGRRLIAAGAGNLVAWNLEELRSNPFVIPAEDGGSRAALFKDETHLVVSSFKREQVLDLTSREARTSAHDWSIKSTDGRRWGREVATGIELFDAVSPEGPENWPIPLGVAWTTVALSEDGNLLATTDQRAPGFRKNAMDMARMRHIHLWRRGEKHSFQVEDINDPPVDLALDPKGRALAARDLAGNLHFWRIPGPSAGRTLANFPRRLAEQGRGAILRTGDELGVLSFSPLGTFLVAFNESEIRMWRVADLDAEPLILRGFEDDLNALAFDRSESRLAAGGKAGQVYIWSLTGNPKTPLVLRGHRGPIASLDFSPSGRWLASEDVTSVVRIWRARTEDLVGDACRLAHRNLSHEEWDLYLGNVVSYRHICPEFPEP